MFQDGFMSYKFGYVILFAIFTNLAINYWTEDYEPSNSILGKDATSAIRRARTADCKKDLTEYAVQQSEQSLFPPERLIRRCHKDENSIQFIKIGCIAYDDDANRKDPSLVRIEEHVHNQTDCLETCFIYGHSYGGLYSGEKDRCLCSESEKSDRIDCDTQDSIEWFKLDQGIFRPTSTNCQIPEKIDAESNQEPKIAFILTLKGRSSLQVKRVLRNIYSAKHIYYLHVDNNENYLYDQLLPLESKYNNIILARNRFATIWGGTQLLAAIIDAFERLSTYDWSYVINLSESDFPIKPLGELESRLRGQDCILLRSHNLKAYNFIKKQGLSRSFYQCERRMWRMGERKLPRGIIYSGGSDWFALPRPFIDYIIDRKNKDSGELVPSLLEIFNHTLLPAESFFHTLALNSEFCDKLVDNNLRVNNWKRKQGGCKCQQQAVVDWCGCSPHVYRSNDLERLKNLSQLEDLYFTRKFDPTISQSVIGSVEQLVLHGEANVSSSFWLSSYDKDAYDDFVSPDGSILRQVAVLASKQIGIELAELKTVDQYFDSDTFVGTVMELCDVGETCFQLLLGPQSRESSSKCESIRPYKLVSIKVGHGFDQGEKIFRNYNPLNTKSDLIVYHEWLVDVGSTMENVSDISLQFQWINPRKSSFAQDIKLKPNSRRSTRLSFAHRLARKGLLDAGLWTLKVSHLEESCVEYPFMVFDDEDGSAIQQQDFNEIYKIQEKCIATTAPSDEGCINRKWSSTQKRTIEEKLF